MGKWVVSVICAILVAGSVQAGELFYFDYDGTLFLPSKSDKNTSGNFDSKIILYKIENRPNLLIEIPNGPREIEVSASDLKNKLIRINDITELEESLLSPKDGRIGSLDKVTLSDGTVIVPGFYHIQVPGSFTYFREAPAGENYLLQDFKRAETLETQKLGTFKGPYWNHMVHLLSTPESAQSFGVITARGHSKAEWKEFFEYLLEKGYIKNLPDLKNIHSINRPEYEKFGMGDSDSARKVGLVRQIILDLSTRKLKNSDYRMLPNGKESGYFHSVTFIEDNQKTLELAYGELRSLAMRRTNVKIVLVNAGLDHEVKKSRKPKTFVITDRGIIRSTNDFERNLRSNLVNANQCSMIFGL